MQVISARLRAAARPRAPAISPCAGSGVTSGESGPAVTARRSAPVKGGRPPGRACGTSASIWSSAGRGRPVGNSRSRGCGPPRTGSCSGAIPCAPGAAVRTCPAIDKAVDRGDFDEIAVHGLPAHDLFIQALLDLGFRFEKSDTEFAEFELTKGMHTLPCSQQLEFFFPAGYGGWSHQNLEIGVLTGADSFHLIIGPYGPYRFEYEGLTEEFFPQWLEEHFRSQWGVGG